MYSYAKMGYMLDELQTASAQILEDAKGAADMGQVKGTTLAKAQREMVEAATALHGAFGDTLRALDRVGTAGDDVAEAADAVRMWKRWMGVVQ